MTQRKQLNVHCSCLQGDRAHQVDMVSFNWKTVLKKPFISDTGEVTEQSLFKSPGRHTFLGHWP